MNVIIDIKNYLISVATTLCLIFFTNFACGQLVELRPLNFGQLAITSNDSANQLSMDYLGNLAFDPPIRIITRGEPGLFVASGFVGNVQLFITTAIQNTVMDPGVVSGEYMQLTALDSPVSVFTETDGTAEVPIGGTIATSGSGEMSFAEATYVSTIRVTINF